MLHTHPAQVAGSFYPADPAALRALIEQVSQHAQTNPIRAPKLIIAPHAGLVFSGAIAATAFAPWQRMGTALRRIVIIGPAHRHPFKGIVTTSAKAWATPLGTLAVAEALLAKALHLADVRVDDAPFMGEHAIEMHLPFLQHVLPHVEIAPFLVGDTAPITVSALIDAVWDDPHTGISLSSDLSHYLDHASATALDRTTRQSIEQLNADALTSQNACGHRLIRGALLQAQKRDLRVTGIDLRTSAQTAGGRQRTVGYGAFAFEHAATARLDAPERATLLQAAQDALIYASQHNGRIPQITAPPALSPCLLAQRASFVTLTKKGRLRGCIGALQPHRALLGDVVVNAVKAGFHDPRFAPLTVEEIKELKISISILSHPRPLQFDDEADLLRQLHPDVDGLILREGQKSGLFLPSVWESLHSPHDFLRGVKRKASLPEDYWSPHLQFFRFSTESIDYNDLAQKAPPMVP